MNFPDASVKYSYSLVKLSQRKWAVLQSPSVDFPGSHIAPWEIYEQFNTEIKAIIRLRELKEN